MSNPHPKAGPGRPKKGDNKRNTEMAIRESAPFAAAYLKGISKGEIKPEALKVRVAEYVINQTIGMAVQKSQNTEAVTIKIEYDEPPVGYIQKVEVIDVGSEDKALISPPVSEGCRQLESEADSSQSGA